MILDHAEGLASKDATAPCSYKKSTSTSRGPARPVSRGRRRARERVAQVVRGTASCSIILQLRERLASQRRKPPGMFKAHTAPRQWEVPGAVLDTDNVLVCPLQIQTTPTATERMAGPIWRRQAFETLLGPAGHSWASFPVTWSWWYSGHRISTAAPSTCLPKTPTGKPPLFRSETK